MSDFILETFLRVIFSCNIALLLFVATLAYIFPRRFDKESKKVNHFVLITGSYWYAILICSAIGLAFPMYMEPVVIIQILYKTLYVIVFLVHRKDANFRPHVVIFISFTVWICVIMAYLITKLVFYLNK
jgi:hypothetical protein